MAEKKRTTKKSGAKKSNKTLIKRSLPEIIIAIVLIFVIGLYYYDVPPLDFDLGIGFKYSQSVKPPVSHTEGELTITFINIGQGDSILLELPDGKTMLIDGGNNTTFKKDDSETRYDIGDTILDVLADKRITELDYVLLTHTDSDHCGSLDEVISSDEVVARTVYMPYVRSKYEFDPIEDKTSEVSKSLSEIEAQLIETSVYESFVQSVVAEGSAIVYSEAGLIIEGEGYRMTFVTPNPSQYAEVKYGDAKAINNVSPIILLEYSTVKVLLTGDAANDGEQIFVDNYAKYGLDVDVDVLKSGHHGSRASSNQFFLDVVKPEYVVVSAGYKNTYNHPEPETLERYAKMNATVYCTIDYGNITLKADKQGFGFEFETIKHVSCEITDPFVASYMLREAFVI